MGVSRSGYYKWKKRDKSKRDIKREELIALVEAVILIIDPMDTAGQLRI